MVQDKSTVSSSSPNMEKDWFAKAINSLKVDQLTFQTDIMEPDKKELYTHLISENYIEVSRKSIELSSQLIIVEMIGKYFSELGSGFSKLRSLSLHPSDKKLLVWAEINDNDEETEDVLLLLEAKINALFSNYKFRVLTTIVEAMDSLSAPTDYVPVKTM